MPFQDITPNKAYPLENYGSRSDQVHVFDDRSINALTAAYLSGRPLLVRGDPGTGKSQLARAAAEVLGWQFLSQVVTAHTEIQDLWCHYDTVNRLGHAQLMGALYSHEINIDAKKAVLKDELCPTKFLSPGVLWWAYDWTGAIECFSRAEHKQYQPEFWQPPVVADESGATENKVPEGVVLLIDEIDKADADLPNSLLETLDCKSFNVPWAEGKVGGKDDGIKRLVIITTNEERQLPPAFIRRCLVLNLDLPKNDDALIELLIDRGTKHHLKEANTELCHFEEDVLREAARQLVVDRKEAIELGYKPPGQAEYLDILRVLRNWNNKEEQLQKLKQIKDFALKKHPQMEQDSNPQDQKHG